MTDDKTYSEITVSPQSPALGAVIGGVDLSKDLSNSAMAEIDDAFRRYSVIFFRDQELMPEQHIAFAERWGKININRFFKAHDDYPMIAEVTKEADQKENIGGAWHTDHSYDQIPAMGSILYALEVPEIGGDTLFSSMYLAYESLSDGMKFTLENLKAWHSSRHAFGYGVVDGESYHDGRLANPDKATQDALHPVVITHPLTGRKALYVNSDFTVRFDGWTAEESKPLLEFLYAHGARPEFTCRFHWQPGSIAFWDNRASWHYALNDYQGYRRVMNRITLEGVALT
ncbi:MAG: TauD/TfdA family dioxygenase [Rhodospirillales bacterium]|nr:TauD/TfdA family dioxygenase [Rhodospirillales bacterium]